MMTDKKSEKGTREDFQKVFKLFLGDDGKVSFEEKSKLI